MTDGNVGRECRHFLVSGRVQGVFYRASTQEWALALGLTGWVRNAENGDVELVACGDPTRLDELEQWLWQGPSAARVGAVRSERVPVEDFPDFAIRR